ncbi:HAD hydrolase-like protein [Allostreptomyces psammosilenae]|uniref:Phosphoglycolate phosphatase-like HAD superfamily hydrolase n=1 Tax=Allostreptomyces psammosilenae TaxID=1892865 RepID=A0A853A3Y2_9ACTN|nr:HAD hydrolase-like protein [Allostreptomyces psammosilenae]NYI07594.1 phosphoglycolate phosphatase-like HAD superfamily hydrolase [Allostreptomyces psammosilenae]
MTSTPPSSTPTADRPRTLVLWDIDHTLMVSGPAGPSVYPRAFALLTGRPPVAAVETDGRTELEIMRDLLDRHGVTGVTEEEVAAAVVHALRAATAELREHGRVLPGAVDALTALHARPDVVQSLLTGNLRPNADLKLRTFDLHAYVDFEAGGYGSDATVRSHLVPVAQTRARARYGAAFGRENTVLIGDTTRDVRAGRDGGARVIGVATGGTTAEALRAAGADVVLSDLRDTAAVVAAVETVAPGPVEPVAPVSGS